MHSLNVVVRRGAAVLGAAALVLGVMAATTPSAYASDRVTFAGVGGGAIPDGGSCPSPGAPRDLTFDVSGIPVGAALSDVRLSDVLMTHVWVADVAVVLIAPDTTQVSIFGRTGVVAGNTGGDSSNLAGPYRFSDRAPGTDWWTAAAEASTIDPVPAGSYRATTSGGPSGGGKPVSITGAFAGLADANGTWTLRVTDACAADTGAITQANLQLEVASDRCNSLNFAVVDAQDAYTVAQSVAADASQAVSDATAPLVTAQNARGTAQTAVATAKTAVTTARTAAQQARTAKDAAADAVIAADVALAKATATLTKAQAATTKATVALATAKKSHKSAAIAKASKALKKAQQNQKTAAAKVTTASGVRNAAQAARAAARQTATDTEQALQLADDALDAARDTLDQAEADLATAVQDYNDASRAEALAIEQMDVAMAAVDHAVADLFDCSDE